MRPDLRVKLRAAGALPLLLGAAFGILFAVTLVLTIVLGVASETPGWLLSGEVLAAAVSAVVLTAVASRWRPRWMTVLGFLLAFMGMAYVLNAPSLSWPGRSRDWNFRQKLALSYTGRACVALGAALLVADLYRRHREKSARLNKRRR